jgi:hypothetical protein
MVSDPVNVVITIPCVLFCRQNVISTLQSFCVSCRSQNVCVCGFVVSERNTGPRASNGTVSALHTRQPHVVLVSELTCTFLHTVISFSRVRLCTGVTKGYAAKQRVCDLLLPLDTTRRYEFTKFSLAPPLTFVLQQFC